MKIYLQRFRTLPFHTQVLCSVVLLGLLIGCLWINPTFSSLYRALRTPAIPVLPYILFISWFVPSMTIFFVAMILWLTDPKCGLQRERRTSVAMLITFMVTAFCLFYYAEAAQFDPYLFHEVAQVKITDPLE